MHTNHQGSPPPAPLTQDTGTPPPRKFAAFAAKALAAGLAGLMAVGAAVVGTSTVAQAADPIPTGTVSQGRITAKDSPIDLVMLDDIMRTQLGAPTLSSRAYYPGTEVLKDYTSGVAVVNSAGTLLFRSNGTGLNGTGTRAFGGTGTPRDPFWVSTTRTLANLVVTKKDSYILGSSQVRTDLSYSNVSTAATRVQMTSWADSYFAGSDIGKNVISESVVSSTAQTNVGASSFIAASLHRPEPVSSLVTTAGSSTLRISTAG